ncbi:MAG: hypothetical protein LBS31_12685, partial [Candidatus Adiutrix sp.]|nr:hypothetical protein [Candidatus Adiutrix sp.]
MKKMIRLKFMALAAICSALALGGCGVVLDMAEDNEWRWGFFGGVDFVSPFKLRVAIAPFEDEVGLGAAGAGENLS